MTSLPPALAALAAYRQFLCYVLAPSKRRPGKMDKLPMSPVSGAIVDAHDPSQWVDADTACAAAAAFGAGHGVAFVFTTDDPFWFIDIDSHFDDATGWSPLSMQIATAFPGAAMELSSNGRGMHLFGRGQVPPHGCRNDALHLEFYTEGRFVALTGMQAMGDANTDHTGALQWLVSNYFPPSTGKHDGAFDLTEVPVPEWNGPTDDDDLIRRALMSRSASSAFGNGASFADLWNCDTERLKLAYPDPDRLYDASSADAALVSHLAFWTGKNGARIERLMRKSKLVRDKWDREDYLPRTICEVLARGGDVLKDKLPEPPSAPVATPEAPSQQVVAGSTFLSPPQQQSHFAGCVYVQDRHRVLVPGGQLLKPDQFRATYGGFTYAMDDANQKTSRNAWEAFTESQALRAPIADSVCFRPDREPGAIIPMAGRKYANAWWPADVPRHVGDVTPFLNHLTNILPNERDRTIVLSYMAACVQYKGTKFSWWPVVQGAEGNGKTTLALCLKEALGRHYVHWIDAVSVKTEFNAFLAGRLLIVIEELRAAHGQDQEEITRKLYTIITGGDGIQIQAKGVDQTSMEICCNGLAFTNHTDAIRKTVNNARRFGLFFCAQQTAADVARDMPGDYFPRMYRWLREEGGFAIVSELLHTFPIPREFDPRYSLHRAPDTSSTNAAIAASLGGVEQHIAEAIAQGLPGFMNGWVSSVAIERLLEELNLAGKITHSRRRQMMIDMGYILHPGLNDGRTNNPVSPDGRKPQLFVKPGSEQAMITGQADIAKRYSLDQTISMAHVLK